MYKMPTRTFSFSITLAFVLALSALPAGAVDFGFDHFAVHGGINTSSDWDDGITLGVSFHLAELFDGLYLAPGIFYSESDTTECALFLGSSCGLSFNLGVENLAIGVELRYFFRGEPQGFYVGGGPYLNQLSLESVVTVGGFQLAVAEAESETVGVLGVAGYKLSWGFAEVRYNAVSDFNSAQLLIGFSFGGGR